MKVAALFSGGKDSTLAARVAETHGWEVSHLVTVEPRSKDSWMFHVPNLSLAPLLAEAWGKPLVRVETAGEAERELGELEVTLAELKREEGIDGFVSGAVASEYQRTRLERVGHRVGLKSFAPLWHKKGDEILASILAEGWDVRLSAVAAEGLTEAHLGRVFDPQLVLELRALRAKHGLSVGGEGGEYESAVLDAPFLRARIEVEEVERVWERDHGEWRIRRATLRPKSL